MQTFWTNHIKKVPPEKSEVWELKYTKGNSIPFDAVKEHQIDALLAAKWNGLYHKLTDPPVFYGQQTRFNVKRPFDCMFIKMVDAYVLIWFYKPRAPKVFVKIDVEEFLAEKHRSLRKSLTEEMALKIGTAVSIVK